jgi:hypothetical protein
LTRPAYHMFRIPTTTSIPGLGMCGIKYSALSAQEKKTEVKALEARLSHTFACAVRSAYIVSAQVYICCGAH